MVGATRRELEARTDPGLSSWLRREDVYPRLRQWAQVEAGRRACWLEETAMQHCRRRRGPYRKLLVPYDGSPGARAALKAAIDLANQMDAELHCICVQEDLSYYGATIGDVEDAKAEQDASLHKLTEEARQRAAYFGVELHTQVIRGRAVEAVVAALEDGDFDLLVIGDAGCSNIVGWIMGRTTQQLARLSPCKVLLVK